MRDEEKDLPRKEVWIVEDREDGAAVWMRVGTAHSNVDGSLTLKISAYPVGPHRMVIRDKIERD